MNDNPLHFTLWDVGYGTSIWINTPNGKHHWFDLGRTPEFSPSEYVRENHSVVSVPSLIISRPDKNHLEDLPSFRSSFLLLEYFIQNKRELYI